jgi:SAM-dependent methyltransferase
MLTADAAGLFRHHGHVTDSVGFDRAAGYYDRTRGMSPEATARLVEVLADELRSRAPILEVGVGTGMIALPLARAGVPIVGMDLSRRMLAKLVEKAGGAPFPLVRGDATALPFREAAFGAAVMRHVLHLIPAWEDAVREVLRVVEAGGVLLVSHGTYPEPYLGLFRRFVEETSLERPWAGLPPGDEDRLDELLEGLGARVRRLADVPDTVEEPLAGFVRGMGEGLYSWTWKVDETERLRAAERVAAWAERELGPLDATATRAHETTFRAYDLP